MKFRNTVLTFLLVAVAPSLAETHHLEAFWDFGGTGAFTDTPVIRVVASENRTFPQRSPRRRRTRQQLFGVRARFKNLRRWVAVDSSEWKRVIVPDGEHADYSDFGLMEHVCEVPIFPTLNLLATQTETLFGDLKFSTAYSYRVRAVGLTSYSQWVYDEFTTLPPPKTTIVVIR